MIDSTQVSWGGINSKITDAFSGQGLKIESGDPAQVSWAEIIDKITNYGEQATIKLKEITPTIWNIVGEQILREVNVFFTCSIISFIVFGVLWNVSYKKNWEGCFLWCVFLSPLSIILTIISSIYLYCVYSNLDYYVAKRILELGGIQ